MKKLFTLAAALLASFSLMAETETHPESASSSVAITGTSYSIAGDYIAGVGGTKAGDMQTKGIKFRINKPVGEIANAVEFTVNEGYAISKIAFCGHVNDNSKTSTITTVYVDGTNIEAPQVALPAKTSSASFAFDGFDAKSSIILVFEGAGTQANLEYEITYGPACKDPEFTIPEDGFGFVGDLIDLPVSSKNQSKPINSAVTVDGVAGEYGTDYTFSVSTGLVQATPLRAGTFEITFSQASDGTYCDAEETVTFVISEKAAVTSFEVEGPKKARLGDEVTLTATNFNAAPTRVWWLNSTTGEQIHEGATYTFTASEYGTFEYYVLARNDFNDPDEESYDYAFGVFGSVEITVGTDASLSDLKVNGATIEGFDATVLEYNLELGVYEALKVEATPTDAPYATAEVVDNNEGKVTITVTAQNTHTQEYIINYTRAAKTELVSISESTTWDWADAGNATPEFKDATMPTKSEEFNFADVLINPAESFNAAALAGIAQFANRGEYFQGNMAKFNTTVAGTVVVTYSNTGGSRPYRHVKVNETMSAEGSANQDKKETEAIAVAAGDVEITFYIPDPTQPQSRDGDVEGPSMGRIYKIVFTATPGAGIDNTEATVKAVKVVRDGQLLIQKNGVLYNAQGAIVK